MLIVVVKYRYRPPQKEIVDQYVDELPRTADLRTVAGKRHMVHAARDLFIILNCKILFSHNYSVCLMAIISENLLPKRVFPVNRQSGALGNMGFRLPIDDHQRKSVA